MTSSTQTERELSLGELAGVCGGNPLLGGLIVTVTAADLAVVGAAVVGAAAAGYFAGKALAGANECAAEESSGGCQTTEDKQPS